MPAERLLASYIVRVLVRAGARHITLHDVGAGKTQSFGSYQELLKHLDARDDAVAREILDKPERRKPP